MFQVEVFWVVTPCSMVWYQSFRDPCCLHLHPEDLQLRTKNVSNIQAAEIKFLSSVKGCTILNRIKSEDIRQKLHVYSVNVRTDDYREKCLTHLHKMAIDFQNLFWVQTKIMKTREAPSKGGCDVKTDLSLIRGGQKKNMVERHHKDKCVTELCYTFQR